MLTTPLPELRHLPRDEWVAALTDRYWSGLPGFLDYEVLELRPGQIEARLSLRPELMLAEGDYLHAGTVVAFADSCAGWGCLASLPDGAVAFTTSELKINLVGTTRAPDALVCMATLMHSGRSMQVWDATVTRESDDRPIAHFRCTQYLLAEPR